MELDAGAQMEGVGDSIGSDIPRFGEPGNHFGVGCEAGEAVEDVGDGASGRDISRERRIHRSWVVGVARIDDGLALRSS